ncbi:MAG: sugar phosphate isomerase/epimerase family protein [Candidatus Limivicinus sp.]|nr:sugar phosphate isomerase/epimerase family protein [Candidatus Limivicinus sp.]
MRFGVHFGYWGKDFSPQNLQTHLQQALSVGAETFELLPPDDVLFDRTDAIQELRKVTDDCGIELLFAFRYPDDCDMASPDPQKRRNAVDFLQRAVRGISHLGGRELGGIIYTKWPARYDDSCLSKEDKRIGTAYSVECMREVVPVAEDLGVTLNMEVVNRFEHYILNTVEEGVAYCRQVESPNLKLLLDTFHMNIEEDSFTDAIHTAGGYLGHFHVNEPNRKVPYHTERVNWPDVGQALRDIGYDGTVTIESFPLSLGQASHKTRIWRDVVEDPSLEGRLKLLKESMEYIKAQFCKS